jgi:hypothetical protein
MSRLLICLSTIVLLPGAGARGATPFDLLPTFDVEIGNDAQLGPGSSSATGSGMGIRNIATRRRVSYVTYDLSDLRGAGQVFLNVSFSNYGHDPGTVNVYGVLEPYEHLVAPGINWNNAPGVMNDPTPPLDTDIVLDPSKLTELLLTFNAPARGARASTDTSQALADFLNSDANGFVAFLFAPEGNANAIVRTIEMGEAGGTRLQGAIGGQPLAARDPNPADRAADVYRREVLSWTAGTYAAWHNVYLGTSFADVNAATVDNPLDVLAARALDTDAYDPNGNLLYGQVYYWRVDGVNALDGTIYRGPVWSFTVEPVVFTMTNILATASSSDPAGGPQNTVDGSGLTDGLYHETSEGTMWLSSKEGDQPPWIQYEFDRAYRLQEMWVWNYNHGFEFVLGFGFKDVRIEHSLDGTNWTVLGETQFDRAPGAAGYAHGAIVDFAGVAARYVRLTAISNWGGLTQSGLSEVRFFYTPTHASHPKPAPGQTGVSPETLLQWRPGREATSHQVHFGADQQAVAEGAAAPQTTTQASFDPGPLDLNKTYYWRIDEVNEAADPSLWQGAVWNFTTREFAVIDDFESYDDKDNRIYEAWVDGEVNKTGSQVGYLESDQGTFGERTIVNSGRQSMPLLYDNNASPFHSEAERSFDPPRDWTAHGVTTLSLSFRGREENAAGQLYLKINGTRVEYAGAADDLKSTEWIEWNVDLRPLSVPLNAVRTLAIGVSGSGASGTLFIDDIRLYP